jgi:Amt family ammonium transporter
MDIYAVHALAGVVGLFMTGLFAQASVAANDGYAVIGGGWLDRNWIQLGKQVAWIAVGSAWTFVMTYLIMFLINFIPGCHFRATEEAEIVGMDEVELGEYVVDYAYHERDLEGNYEPTDPLPTRAPAPTRGPGLGKMNSSGSSEENKTSTMIRPTSGVFDEGHRLSRPDSIVARSRSRSRGRGLAKSGTRDGDNMEMQDVDMAALRRAEAKVAAQQEEYFKTR